MKIHSLLQNCTTVILLHTEYISLLYETSKISLK